MTDNSDRQQEIDELRAALAMPGLPDAARREIQQRLDRLRAADADPPPAADPPISGDVTVSDTARINGVAVGVNLGRIVYGRDPAEDERRRLVWYLARLANTLSRLPLRGLEERLDQGKGVALPHVYIGLAVQREVVLSSGTVARLGEYLEPDEDTEPPAWVKTEYRPDHALPETAVRRVQADTPTQTRQQTAHYTLWRAGLATEVAGDSTRLVLLGDPGSGKSTFVGHLAWALARRGLDQADETTGLPGWDDRRQRLPIVLSLRSLAGRIAHDGPEPATVLAALREVMQTHCMHNVDDLLNESLHSGAALLLCDGLDEAPLNATRQSADRTTTLTALRAFAAMHPRSQVLLTCRTRAFSEELRQTLGWPVETLAPLTLGQVRRFVPAWYGELVSKQQITPEQCERLSDQLIAAVAGSPKLSKMAETPLLLTLMALVLFNRGELPRDRPQLYERVLELLLGQWDRVRDGQNLAEAVGLPDWGSERFRPLLDRLAFDAHTEATSEDGRGRLERGTLYTALLDYFRTAQVVDFGNAAMRWLDYVDERSGLLSPDGPISYVMAHLTLQEHCAGRHLARNVEDPVALVMQLRIDDRWREPIFLGAGLMPPAVLNALLSELIDCEDKPDARWYRDLILAAELGADRDWNYLRTLPILKVDRLQRDLRTGLVALLADTAQPLPVAERVRAGFLLGELGDPRFPITIDDWQRELQRALDGDTDGYFCRIEAGAYIIGSVDDDPDARNEEKPQHTIHLEQPLLIARYPITNAQWQAWVQAGGESSNFADHTDLNHRNQPVTGVSQRMATAFCEWLSEQLGISIRLPSEQEWEAAARGGDARRYPWDDAWQDDRAACEDDREQRDWAWTTPVGCYPAGAAPNGPCDMAGNVWEWTVSIWQSYPGAEKAFTNKDRVVLRGGAAWRGGRTYVRCGARIGTHPDFGFGLDYGFRVLAAPPLAHLS